MVTRAGDSAEGGDPNLRGDEDVDERARLEVPHFEVAILAGGVDGLAVDDDGKHRAGAALERVQQHPHQVRGRELPELYWRKRLELLRRRGRRSGDGDGSHGQSAGAG